MYRDYDDYLADKCVELTTDDVLRCSKYMYKPCHEIYMNQLITYMLSNKEIEEVLYNFVVDMIKTDNYDLERYEQYIRDYSESIEKYLKEEE